MPSVLQHFAGAGTNGNGGGGSGHIATTHVIAAPPPLPPVPLVPLLPPMPLAPPVPLRPPEPPVPLLPLAPIPELPMPETPAPLAPPVPWVVLVSASPKGGTPSAQLALASKLPITPALAKIPMQNRALSAPDRKPKLNIIDSHF